MLTVCEEMYLKNRIFDESLYVATIVVSNILVSEYNERCRKTTVTRYNVCSRGSVLRWKVLATETGKNRHRDRGELKEKRKEENIGK